MAHILYGNAPKRDDDDDDAAVVAPSMHYGPPLFTHEEMMKEINQATKRELAELEKKLKSDLELVDRTAHFRQQFLTTASFRLHYPTWFREMKRLLFPFQYIQSGTDIRAVWAIIALWTMLVSYTVVGFVNFLGATSLPQFLARFFDRIEVTSVEFWTPAIFYFVFAFVVATQASIWSIGGAADKKRFQKLENMKILHFTEQGQVVTLNAREVALAVLRKGALFKGGFKQLIKTVMIGALISALYLSLPFIYSSFKKRGRDSDVDDFGVSFSLTGLSSILGVSFKFILSTLALTELGTSLLNLYERLVLLRVFTDITSRRRSSKRFLPFIKLYTPENIVCWQSIREYVLAHHQARLGWFQVLTAFGAAYVAFVSLSLGLRFWYKEPFGLADVQGFFVIFIGGIYALIIIFIGAMVDGAQKSHVKVLLKQKWKLQRHLIRYQENLDFPTKKLSFDVGGSARTNEMIDGMMFGEENDGDDISDDSTDSESDEAPKASKGKSSSWFGSKKSQKTPKRAGRGGGGGHAAGGSPRSPESSKFSSPGSGSGSPLSPISLTTPLKGREQEIAEECQKLLSRLIKVLEKTDQPLRLLGYLKVDTALAIKVGGILASVLISRMKSIFTK